VSVSDCLWGVCVRVLVVYDSVSPMRLTEKVAEAVASVLREAGLEVDSRFVRDFDSTSLKEYDCVVVGAPTMAFRASAGIMRFLNGLSGDFSGKCAAAFDTQVRFMLSGNAAKGIEGRLKRLGFRLVAPPLVTYVEGKQNEMRLKEGELEAARNWAKTVVEALAK
jgi:flavodoxin